MEFIERNADRGVGTIVNCTMGMSRSPTIVMAYLMKRYGYTLDQSFDMIYEKRDCIGPNE